MNGRCIPARGKHLSRQQRADGVRDRIVNVQQIERVELGDLGHASGEREIVRRVFEQRIVRDRNLVKVNVGLTAAQSKGLRIGDEVDLMPARRELDAKLRGDDAAAAVRGITGDADLHRLPIFVRLRA